MTPEEIRDRAEQSLEFFINLVAPTQVLGDCHKDVINWWYRPGHKHHQLLLFPRDHGKSRLVAYRVAWELTRDPTLRVLYISATANLAEKQLTFIKGLMTSPIYRRYWPDHIHPEEGKRTKWTNSEIALDHPKRVAENIRDPSVFTAGLTTSITGMHCDIAVLDDVVVAENAYNEEGRNKVRTQYSLLSSIEGADANEWVVGTRYHPKDLYNDMMEMREDVYDENGEKVDEDNIYEIYERAVEDMGDGTGQFLWPRQQRRDGKWFGFDARILAQKRGKYLDRMQFRAQYYNDPQDPDNERIAAENFQYYDPKFLSQDGGHWYFKDRRLNLTASIDFAYSLRKTADYTAIVVVGVDAENNVYVLDIDRFKTTDIGEYFDHILRLHNKWDFRKLAAEVSVAQKAIVQSLKTNYIATHGLAIKVEEVRPTRSQGSKEERIEAVLGPRYDNLQIYHYRGGNTQVLEEELTLQNPPHDDVIDALATAIEHSVKPANTMRSTKREGNIVWHSRFGGRAH